MPCLSARIAAVLLVFLSQAEAGQSYSTHGSVRSTYRSSMHGGGVPPSHYGATRYHDGYNRYYPADPVYPAYPVYPVHPANSRWRGPGYHERGRTLPSTHTYGYYDFKARRKCLNGCDDRRDSGGDYRRGYRDGYDDGRRDRHDGRDDHDRCRGEDC
jgi:hypothetical protein